MTSEHDIEEEVFKVMKEYKGVLTMLAKPDTKPKRRRRIPEERK